MMLYISMKFHENILNGLTLNYHCRIFKGYNSKNVQTRVTVLMLCTSSDDVYTSMKPHENFLNSFQVIELIRNDHCEISKGKNYKTTDKSYGSCVVHVV